MNKKVKNMSLWLGIWCFQTVQGCIGFRASSIKQTSPYLINKVFPHGEVELKTKEGVRFKVNRERIKLYFGHTASVNEVIEAYHLDEG